jgi:hypothetical protein
MNMIGKGLKECDKGTRKLIEADRGGCPFAVSKNWTSWTFHVDDSSLRGQILEGTQELFYPSSHNKLWMSLRNLLTNLFSQKKKICSLSTLCISINHRSQRNEELGHCSPILCQEPEVVAVQRGLFHYRFQIPVIRTLNADLISTPKIFQSLTSKSSYQPQNAL